MKVRCIFFLTINYQHRTLCEAHWQTAPCCASPASLGLQHGWEETVGCPTPAGTQWGAHFTGA